MSKKFLIGSVVAGAMMVLPIVASAATVTSQAVFSGGQTQTYGNAGQSVSTNFQVHVNAGEVLHAIRTKVDSQPTVCTTVGPFEGDQTVTLNTNITYPPNSSSGGYSLVADLFTTDTMPQAQAMTGDLACSSAGAGAHIFANAYNGATVVNVLPSSGGGTGSTSTSQMDALTALVAQLAAQVQAILHPVATAPAPTSNAMKCAALADHMIGAQFGVRSGSNGVLQGFLIGEHMSIPLLQNNQATYGFWGTQTNDAVNAYKNQFGC